MSYLRNPIYLASPRKTMSTILGNSLFLSLSHTWQLTGMLHEASNNNMSPFDEVGAQRMMIMVFPTAASVVEVTPWSLPAVLLTSSPCSSKFLFEQIWNHCRFGLCILLKEEAEDVLCMHLPKSILKWSQREPPWALSLAKKVKRPTLNTTAPINRVRQ